MEVFETNDGHVYVAINKRGVSKDDAVTIANRHFKLKKSILMVETGRIVKGKLKIGIDGNYWVISRRSK